MKILLCCLLDNHQKVMLQDMIKHIKRRKNLQLEKSVAQKRERVVFGLSQQRGKQKFQEDVNRLGLGLAQYVRLKIFQN